MGRIREKIYGRDISLICIIALRYIFFDNRYSQRLLKIRYVTLIGWFIYRNLMRLVIILLSYFDSSSYIRNDPFNLIWIDTDMINYGVDINYNDLEAGIRYGRVIDGDWDTEGVFHLREMSKYSSIASFIKTGDWEKSDMSSAYRDRSGKWCENIEDRIKNINQLKKSIESGYKTQKTLCENDLSKQIRENNDVIFPQLNEIQVAISHQGEIMWNNTGLHRLAISKGKNIDKIPVLIRYRHKDWQEKRKKAIKNPEKLTKKEKNHPDIENLIKNNQQ